ncbi:MAG: ABC transporter permease subunit [Chloroflexi bacterium]|nr:ABC transporter permease subunit [Chloroflexota bacterium]
MEGNIITWFTSFDLPIGELFEIIVDFLNTEMSWLFDIIKWPIDQFLNGLEDFLIWLPWWVVLLAIVGFALWRTDWKIAALSGVSMLLIRFLEPEYWELTMTTLGMIITAVVFSVIVGVPLGIWAALDERVNVILRPILDAMQTIHPFVYLVPTVILLGPFKVPGTIVTIIFALPPIVRLTNLGIRQVPEQTVEAAKAFGSSQRQTLFKVQLPLALPTIMAGLNQTLMLSLSMVVIAALIAAGGIGQEILRSVGRVDVGRAVEAGLVVLLLAIVLDRLSQSLAERTEQAVGA